MCIIVFLMGILNVWYKQLSVSIRFHWIDNYYKRELSLFMVLGM